MKWKYAKRRFRQKKLCISISLAVSLLCYSCGSMAYAEEAVCQSDNNAVLSLAEGTLQSKGSLVYQEMGMAEAIRYDAEDIWKIQEHLDKQKSCLLEKLLQLGTGFLQTENGWQFSRNPEKITGELPEGSAMDWNLLLHAVTDSQQIPENLTVAEPKICLGIEGISEYTDYYTAATADNLSRGKAAWLEGVLLLGTGKDNDKAYEQGKKDGTEGTERTDMVPIFAAKEQELVIRHKHIGESSGTEGIDGCYKHYITKTIQTDVCGQALNQTEVTWYPNEAEEGGGSWHGGYYTCPWHGGVYENPGVCPYENSQEISVWHHDLICGKTDLIYAVLTISGMEEDDTDGKILLCAELQTKEGFAQLQLPEAEQDWLIWSNEAGEIIGTGKTLEVMQTGKYFCRLAAANQEVDNLSIGTEVIKKGFAYGKK